MIRDITLGQYYDTDSVIHRLDARTKLFGTFMFLIALFLTKNPIYYSILIFLLIVYIYMSRVPVSYMLRGLKPVFFLILFSMALNLFKKNGTVICEWWVFRITDYGVENALFVGARMVMMILGASVLTYTTLPTDLTDGLEAQFHWMERFQVPVHDIAMMMSIALRFIPVLVEELNRLMKAQMSRGAEFEEGNLIERLKAMLPVIVPLFVAAARRAEDLAIAMEARCYHGGVGRTKMFPLKRGWKDYLAYVIIWLMFLGGFVVMIKAYSL
ncbi:MAG: energy-coupling factor transporter transmembrane protein EcfT [Lachnospiraceae bacterium]|nr:energy-coupling factor transporter transmembrane protein EcfT [Lachnospiraceae bacterium]